MPNPPTDTTMKSWNDILEATRKGNHQPFNQAYALLIQKFRPVFTQKYHSVETDFDSIFNDKIIEILHRSLNDTLTIKNEFIDGVLYTAINNKYREIIRSAGTNKAQAKPIFVELPPMDILKEVKDTEEEYSDMYYFEKDLQLKLMDQSIKELDEIGQIICNGKLEGKRDQQIKAELQWKASNAAFSDKKKRTFKNFRKIYYHLRAKYIAENTDMEVIA